MLLLDFPIKPHASHAPRPNHSKRLGHAALSWSLARRPPDGDASCPLSAGSTKPPFSSARLPRHSATTAGGKGVRCGWGLGVSKWADATLPGIPYTCSPARHALMFPTHRTVCRYSGPPSAFQPLSTGHATVACCAPPPARERTRSALLLAAPGRAQQQLQHLGLLGLAHCGCGAALLRPQGNGCDDLVQGLAGDSAGWEQRLQLVQLAYAEWQVQLTT